MLFALSARLLANVRLALEITHDIDVAVIRHSHVSRDSVSNRRNPVLNHVDIDLIRSRVPEPRDALDVQRASCVGRRVKRDRGLRISFQVRENREPCLRYPGNA